MAAATPCSFTSSQLVHVYWDHHLFISKTMTPNTPPSYARSLWPKKDSDRVLHRQIWPPESPDLKPIYIFGMIWPTEPRKSSQQVLSICGNSFKTIGSAFQVTTSWTWEKVCKAVIQAKGGRFKHILVCIHIFAYSVIPCVFFFVMVSSVLSHSVGNNRLNSCV